MDGEPVTTSKPPYKRTGQSGVPRGVAHKVRTFMFSHPGLILGVDEVAVSIDENSRSTSDALGNLCRMGTITRTGRGRYCYTGPRRHVTGRETGKQRNSTMTLGDVLEFIGTTQEGKVVFRDGEGDLWIANPL